MNLHCLCCLSHYIADHKKKPEVQFWSRAWNNILHYQQNTFELNVL